MKPISKYTFAISTSVIAFGFASLFHFLYEWLGKSSVAGIFFPVNESVWEHGKLCFYPLLLIWILFYLLRGSYLTLGRSINSFAGSSLLCVLVVYSGYYLLDYGFSLKGLWVDLLLLGIGMLAGQFLGIHILKRRKSSGLSWLYLFLMAAIFAALTFYPPNFPIFQI